MQNLSWKWILFWTGFHWRGSPSVQIFAAIVYKSFLALQSLKQTTEIEDKMDIAHTTGLPCHL